MKPKKPHKPDEKQTNPVIATHHEAGRDYHILETIEAGVVLVGCEVKSLRSSKATLSGSFARIDAHTLEAFLHNLYIAPYPMGNRENPEPMRVRKLLLHRREIEKLKAKTLEKGLALIPLKLYFRHGVVKVEIGVCRGKKSHDKRQDLKKQSARREIDRAIKNRNRG